MEHPKLASMKAENDGAHHSTLGKFTMDNCEFAKLDQYLEFEFCDLVKPYFNIITLIFRRLILRQILTTIIEF